MKLLKRAVVITLAFTLVTLVMILGTGISAGERTSKVRALPYGFTATTATQQAGQASAAPLASTAAPTNVLKLAPGTTKEESGCWPWPDSLDAVRADPQNHVVLYEDVNVRMVDVHTPPMQINSKHDHQWLSVFMQDEPQPRGRDHGTDGTAGPAGGAIGPDAPFPLLNIAGTQAPHAYENLDTFTKHFYRMELKKIPFECPGPDGAMLSYVKERMRTSPDVKVASWPWSQSMDQIITSPETDVVRFELYDIRLVEVTVAPGQTEHMGEQLYPSVLVFYEPQPKGILTSYDGKTTNVMRQFEDVKFPQAIRQNKQPPHSFQNTDTIPAHYYRVEFKKIAWKG